VLLVGDGSRRLNVSRQSLPKGIKEGTWLRVELDGDKLHSAEIDAEETERAKQRIAEKLNRLRRGEHRE
jgi:hypothetical protein